MSKILNKRIFAALLASTVAFSTIPVKIVANENQFTVEASKLGENSSFEMLLTQEVDGAARIGDEVYSTIAEAVAAAHEGDTIVISRGTYTEPIVLGNKSITLEGTGSHETILTGGITFKNESYEGSNITIRNLSFKQNGIYFNVNEDLSKMEALIIEDNIFKNAPSHARVYTVCIENTSNPINGLAIRNNEFVFEDAETYKEGVLGGINATVYGDAEITGNTFKNMPYNGILLYGVGNGSEHTINLSENTFEEWGFNTKGYGGRAIRISGVGEAGKVDITNNKYVCKNMPEEYIKITGNKGSVDMSGSYWNGDHAAEEGFVSDGTGTVSANCKLICNGEWKIDNYFIDDTMKELKHEAKIGETIYSSVAAALKAAKDGDTVIIKSGTITEPILLDHKSITLEGTGDHETVLTGGITFKDESYEGSNITIKNLKFEQKGIQFKVGQDKDLSKMEGFTVENNQFENAANGASMYALYIVNTNNAMNGLMVRNNEFMFSEGTGQFLGGLCVAVCGDAEITGNTFKNMPFNAITLYGVENGANGDQTQKLTISNNIFEEWGFNTETGEGRAMRLSGVAGEVDLTNNKFVCKNMPEEYIKITGNVGHVDMSKCYWNGDDATVEGFVWDGTGDTPENGKVICDGRVVLENYFVADTMRDPQDLNTYEAPEEKPVFTDTLNHWAAEDINFVVERGLFNGTGAATFSPNTQMTRGAFAVVLGRLAGVDVSGYVQSSFSDVKADAYYMGYVEWASENKLVNGMGNGKFAPDQGISREQVAVILTNYAKAFGYDFPTRNKETQFSDSSKISNWAKEAVKKVQMAGIMGSRANNKFEPQGIATRAEVATVIKRFIEFVIERN